MKMCPLNSSRLHKSTSVCKKKAKRLKYKPDNLNKASEEKRVLQTCNIQPVPLVADSF